MAGDININEVMIANLPEQSADVANALSPPADAPPHQQVHVLHNFGRVIIAEAPGDTPTESEPYGVNSLAGAPPPAALGELTDVEQVGLAALRLRESAGYAAAKARRPRSGEEWNMTGCLVTGPDGSTTAAPDAAGAPSPAGAASPTSAYLEGSVAVGVIIVEGPTDALTFSQEERTKVVAEVQNGLGWLAAANPAAGVSFTYDYHVVTLDVEPDEEATDLEALWRNPAMAALGHTADWAGVNAYVADIRTRHRTRWAYVAFFTKYPLHHFAYAGGPRVVMDYHNDGWGPDNIDAVFAHETGHIFQCPDEYAGSGCNCAGSHGRFATPNANCAPCAPGGGADCLMRANTFALCRWTPSHLGWGRGVGGNPVLLQSRFGRPGNFEVLTPSRFSGITHLFRDNNVSSMPWSEPRQFGQVLGRVDAISAIQSNYGNPGNLELIARAGTALHFFWRDSGPAFRWHGPFHLANGAAGNPVLIQSRFGAKGNFELAYPAADNGVMLMWRNNDTAAMPWSRPHKIGQELGRVDSVSLIQSNYGNPGNLELITRTGDVLHFFWRDSGPNFKWSGPYRLL